MSLEKKGGYIDTQTRKQTQLCVLCACLNTLTCGGRFVSQPGISVPSSSVAPERERGLAGGSRPQLRLRFAWMEWEGGGIMPFHVSERCNDATLLYSLLLPAHAAHTLVLQQQQTRTEGETMLKWCEGTTTLIQHQKKGEEGKFSQTAENLNAAVWLWRNIHAESSLLFPTSNQKAKLSARCVYLLFSPTRCL